MAKRKLSKRELKENRLLTYVLEITKYIKKHFTLIKITVIIILVVILLVISFSVYFQKMNKKGEIKFVKAINYYREGKDKKEVLTLFQEILDDYPHSASAAQSLFYKGECYYYLGEYDKAVQSFKKYLDKYPRKEFAPLSLVSLGNTYEQKGRYEEALTAYHKFVDKYKNNFLIGDVYLAMGRVYEQINQWGKAQESYQKILDFYPQSFSGEDARWRIDWIKAKKKNIVPK